MELPIVDKLLLQNYFADPPKEGIFIWFQGPR